MSIANDPLFHAIGKKTFAHNRWTTQIKLGNKVTWVGGIHQLSSVWKHYEETFKWHVGRTTAFNSLVEITSKLEEVFFALICWNGIHLVPKNWEKSSLQKCFSTASTLRASTRWMKLSHWILHKFVVAACLRLSILEIDERDQDVFLLVWD